MAAFRFLLCLHVFLLQCDIAAVAALSAAAGTTMFPQMSGPGNNIAKVYTNNRTDEEPSNQSKVGDLTDHLVTDKGFQETCLVESMKTHQPSALLNESKRRIWCFGPHADSKVKNQRHYLPVRFLSVLRKKDLIILPGNHAPTREFVDFMIPLLGLSHDQIIWTSGDSISIDSDIDAAIQSKITEIIRTSGSNDTSESSWVLVPYCATKDFLSWSSKVCEQIMLPTGQTVSSNLDERQERKEVYGIGPTLEVFGESESWNAKYGHKGILHRHMADLSIPSVIEDIDMGSSPTNVAKGYQCSTVEHLLEAYKLLKQETHDNRAVIKPITGCAGWGIIFINSAEDLSSYDFPMGEVLLEEMLNLDLTEDGLVISPAVHYLGTELFGGRLVDQLMRNTSYLGWRESKADPEFQQKVLDITEKLLRFTQPKGPGGYDFLSVNGEPVLSDVNTGRFNGAHQPKLFLSQYAPQGSMWYCWKHKPSTHVTVSQMWNALNEENIAFNPNAVRGSCMEGVFPLTYLRGVDGIFLAVAGSTDRAFEIYQNAANILDNLEKEAV